jgi:hypothetical protein
MGTSTAIDIHQIYCYGCSFGGQQFYVKLYSRLTDTNYAVQGYTEAGYQVNSSNNAYPYYYYCNNPPNSYIPDCHLIASVSLSDFGSKLRIKMTRNRQGAGNMLIQVWTDAGYNPAPMVVSNNMGGAYGTSLAYAGTQKKLKLEVLGCSCSVVSQGTYGMIHWENNYWQYSNGTYQYQTANGNAGVTYGGPMSAYMQPFPNQSSTGGTFNTNCAC